MAVNLIVGTNSYISVVDATAYFAERLWSTAWFEATAEQQAQALIMATKVLDRQLYKGKLKDSSQVLKFPRCYKRYPLAGEWDYVGNLAESIYDRDWYCEVSVHKNVKEACCEEALALLARGNSKRRTLQQSGVQSFSMGGLSESYKANAGQGLISAEAIDLLKPYRAGAVRST
jgi:hypothetical protein